MKNINEEITLAYLEQRAQLGKATDINYLMETLATTTSFLHSKMIDYALGRVTNEEGRERIKYFLFNGNKIQRNYAALYFKRQGACGIIDEAFEQGCIDHVQAYAK